jgi:hypothetical protein
MKTTSIILLLLALFTTTGLIAHPNDDPAPRVTFMLKNTLGYHRMFLVEGPGIKYGFTMGRRETVPCHWPVGAKLYFSNDGETGNGLILTVTADDDGKTLTTGDQKPDKPQVVSNVDKPAEVTVLLRNNRARPSKIALISYRPDEQGNGTSIFVMIPYGIRRATFPPGTKLYVADKEQVDVIMSGKRIDSGKPFLTVQKEHAFQTVNLFD